MASTPMRYQQWAMVLGTAGAMFVAPVFAQGQAADFDYDTLAEVGDAGEPLGLFDVGDGDAEGDSNINIDSFGKVDLAVKDLEIAKVLQLLSIQSQKNIVTSRNVSGTVSADLYGVTFHEAMSAILEPNGFGYEEKGNFIYVYTAEELKERKDAARSVKTKIIRLNYLNGDDAKGIAEAMLSDAGTVTFSSGVDDGFLPSESSAGGNDFALSDAVIIRDYEENIVAIESLIAELDIRPRQVLIEATILQAQLTEKNAFGVDFAVFSNLNAFDFANPLNAVGNLINGGGPAGDSGGGVQSTVGNTSGPGGVKVGYVGSDAAVFVRALDSVTDTTVVAKPNILVLNRMKADLLVGQRLGYLSTTVTDTSNTQTVEFLDVGTQLTVRPFISNEGTIRLELRPAISDGTVREQAGFVIPDETTQELITNIIVEDGQTVVIGGLFKEDTTNNRNQVPGLGNIPLLGAAFQGKDDTVERTEVIFLIKTTIMEPSQMALGGDAAEEAIRNKRLGAKQGLLPWSTEKLVSSNLLTARQALEAGNNKKALWHTNLALHISPVSADALALKQEITGEQIAYQDRSQLKGIMDTMINADVEAMAPQAQPQESIDFTEAVTEEAPTIEVAEFEVEVPAEVAVELVEFETEVPAEVAVDVAEFETEAPATVVAEVETFDTVTETFEAESFEATTPAPEVVAEVETEAFSAVDNTDTPQAVETVEVMTEEAVAFDAQAAPAAEVAEADTTEWEFAFPEDGAETAAAESAGEFTADAQSTTTDYDADQFFESGASDVPEFATEIQVSTDEAQPEVATEVEEASNDEVFDYYDQLMTEVETETETTE